MPPDKTDNPHDKRAPPVQTLIVAGACSLFLASCVDLTELTWPTTGPEKQPRATAREPVTGFSLEEREIEVPHAFHRTGIAVWDGSDHADGIWVAHAATVQPERVVIRNPGNGQSAVGDLYRRNAVSFEREFDVNSVMLLSAAAARALGISPNVPSRVEVTAIRREIVSIPDPEGSI